jgi:uncharacterized protein (TIRG00374 family)
VKRRWLLWLLIAIFGLIVISRFTEIAKLAETLARGRWQWVLAAALLQVGRYVLLTAVYWSSFDVAGVESRMRELLPVVFASLFVSVAAPVAGAGGLALLVDDALQRGQSAARASVGTLLVLLVDYVVFVLVLGAGLAYLSLQHQLRAFELIASALLLLLVAGLTSVLLLSLWKPGRLRGLLDRGQRAANRLAAWLKWPALLGDDWAARNAGEFTAAARAIVSYPQRLARTLAVAVAMWLVNVASLFAVFLAFYQPVGLGILVAGFAVGVLFWLITITPHGIGVVEGVMVLVFTSLGVPLAQATVITLAFRGLSFWLPLAIGFLLVRRVRSFHGVPRTEPEPQDAG